MTAFGFVEALLLHSQAVESINSFKHLRVVVLKWETDILLPCELLLLCQINIVLVMISKVSSFFIYGFDSPTIYFESVSLSTRLIFQISELTEVFFGEEGFIFLFLRK